MQLSQHKGTLSGQRGTKTACAACFADSLWSGRHPGRQDSRCTSWISEMPTSMAESLVLSLSSLKVTTHGPFTESSLSPWGTWFLTLHHLQFVGHRVDHSWGSPFCTRAIWSAAVRHSFWSAPMTAVWEPREQHDKKAQKRKMSSKTKGGVTWCALTFFFSGLKCRFLETSTGLTVDKSTLQTQL